MHSNPSRRPLDRHAPAPGWNPGKQRENATCEHGYGRRCLLVDGVAYDRYHNKSYDKHFLKSHTDHNHGRRVLSSRLFAACVIVDHVLWSLAAVVLREGIFTARLRIAEGVLAALSFSFAGTLLKTIALQSLPEIRAFTFIFLLRTLLKRIFSWEERTVESRHVAEAT